MPSPRRSARPLASPTSTRPTRGTKPPPSDRTSTVRKSALTSLASALVLAGAAGHGVSVLRTAHSADEPLRRVFDVRLIERGSQLSAIGNCSTCHTAPEGRPYAGGLP